MVLWSFLKDFRFIRFVNFFLLYYSYQGFVCELPSAPALLALHGRAYVRPMPAQRGSASNLSLAACTLKCTRLTTDCARCCDVWQKAAELSCNTTTPTTKATSPNGCTSRFFPFSRYWGSQTASAYSRYNCEHGALSGGRHTCHFYGAGQRTNGP